jgi:SAM-dependent methyltransferase
MGSILVLWGVLALALAGWGLGKSEAETAVTFADSPKGSFTLQLTLPESAGAPSWAPHRISKLKIDGKDYSTPRDTKRTIKLDRPADPKKKITIEYNFWPVSYVNIIRTKKVSLPRGDTLEVDLTKKQDDDQIIPIYYPTPKSVVAEMCKMGKVGKGDVVYDIGCGDGRIVIAAVKDFGAKKGVGIDIRKEMIDLCKENAKRAGVADKVEFRVADALKIKDFSEANAVLLYLGNELNEALRPTLQKTLKPGSRIVSHRFLMGDWKPEVTRKINAINNDGRAEDYLLHRWTIKKKE